MHVVLLIDDDRIYLESMKDWMEATFPGIVECVLASSAGKALKILKTTSPELIILDLDMPVMDGQQLVKLLHLRYPQLKKVVMTGMDLDRDHLEALQAIGALLVLQKPVHPDDFETVHHVLATMLEKDPQDSGFHATLQKVGLPDVIQMQCSGLASCVFMITSGSAQGTIFITNGKVVHATYADLEGDQAFYRIVGLSGGKMEILEFVPPEYTTIELPWQHLLMEAARLKDEQSQEESVPAGFEVTKASQTVYENLTGIMHESEVSFLSRYTDFKETQPKESAL